MSRLRKFFVWFVCCFAIVVGLITVYSVFEYTLVPDIRERIAGAAEKDGVALGRLLFETRGCAACHTLGSLSTSSIGPELTAIAENASPTEIAESIVDPDAEISTNCGNKPCSAGLMPQFGEILDEREISALVAFLLQYDSGESNVR